MINIVIADDEERICKLIKVLGKWDELGMQVIGTALNGIDALHFIGNNKTDVLITDIRMPGCDGLELIEKVRKLSPGIKIIVISGYALFEYAQMAMKYEVKDYLLKPINQDALNESLLGIKQQIEEERQKNREKEDSITKLRSALITDLLAYPDRIITDDILKKQYHFSKNEGIYEAFCIKMDYEAEESSFSNEKNAWEKMSAILQNKLKEKCFDYILAAQDSYLYGVMNFAVKYQEEMKRILRDSLNQMEVQKELFGNAEFSMALGLMVTTPEELIKSLNTAKLVISERIVAGTGKILVADTSKQVLYEKRFLDKYIRNISNALENLSVDMAESAVDELYQDVIATRNAHGWEIFELTFQAGNMFVMRLDLKDKNEILNYFYVKCENCYSIKALFNLLKNFVRNQMNEILSEREEDFLRPVRLAKKYIQNHFREQITLEEVSESVGLTPAYFSGLFKKETEVGFAKYLVNVRMEAAKELLRESNLPVVEICRSVGYNDIKHFTHNFEKNAGLKPTVYRKLYG